MNLYNDIFPVCYGQFYFLSESGEGAGLEECFTGQSNGLCGAAHEGILFFITGLHTGNISLKVDYLTSKPEVDPAAEEIVEVSFYISEDGCRLESWGGEYEQELNLESGWYRVRYSAIKFGLAEELDELESGKVEKYQVEIWRSPRQADQVILATEEAAKYWHSEAKKQHLV